MAAGAIDQDSFRGRNDDGSESAATWKATTNTNWSQDVDVNFRVRFGLQEYLGGASNNFTAQLQYSLNSGTWTNVTGSSSVVRSYDTTYVSDGADCTQQITSGTFISNNDGFDDVNGASGGGNLDFTANSWAEVEFCVRIQSGDVVSADSIRLRIAACTTWTNTPTITVTEASAIAGTATLDFAGTSTVKGKGKLAGTADTSFGATILNTYEAYLLAKLSTGLLQYLHCGDSSPTLLEDLGPNNYDAAYAGSPNWAQAGLAKSNYGSVQFDSNGDYLKNDNGVASRTRATPSFTVVVWAKMTGAGATISSGSGGATGYPLVTKGYGFSDTSGDNVNYFLSWNTGNYFDCDYEETTGPNHRIFGDITLSTGRWYMFSFVRNATTDYNYIYVDNVEDTSANVTQDPEAAANCRTGTGNASNSSDVWTTGWFNGYVTHVSIWNVALTAAQIEQLWLHGSGHRYRGSGGVEFGGTSTVIAKSSGGISGTAAIDFGGTSTLSAKGKLYGTIAGVEFSGTSTLRAKGKLAGTATVDFAGTSTIRAKGELSGTGTLDFAGTSTLRGKGKLEGPATVDFGGTSTLKGKGLLSGSAPLVFDGSATPLLPGAISGTTTLDFAGLSTARGTGRLVGTGTLDFAGTSTVRAKGMLRGTATLDFAGTSSIRAKGILTGTATITFGGTSTARASGTLIGTGSLTFAGTSTARGTGRIVGTATLVFDGSATATIPSGYIIGTSTLLFGGSGTLSTPLGKIIGTATLTFGGVSRGAKFMLRGSAPMVFAGVSTGFRRASISGTADLSFGGTSALRGRRAALGYSAIEFVVLGSVTGDGALSGIAALVFGGIGSVSGRGIHTRASDIRFNRIYPSKPPAGSRICCQHPLASGLMLYLPLYEAGGQFLWDQIEGMRWTGTAGAVGDRWKPGSKGIARAFVGSSSHYDLGVSTRYSVSGSHTMAVVWTPDSTTGTQTIWSRGTNSTTTFNYYLKTNGTEVRAGFSSASAFVDHDTSGADLNAGQHFHIVAVYDDENDRYKIWVNGVKYYDAAETTAVVTPGAWFSYLGRFGTYASLEYATGRLDHAALWKRPLRDQEVLELYADPYAIFAAPRTFTGIQSIGDLWGISPLVFAGTSTIHSTTRRRRVRLTF